MISQIVVPNEIICSVLSGIDTVRIYLDDPLFSFSPFLVWPNNEDNDGSCNYQNNNTNKNNNGADEE